MTRPSSLPLALVLGLLAAAPLAGCKGKGGGVLAKAELADDAFAHVPVPSADGPKLFAIARAATVYDRPNPAAKKVGELRVGAAVARSKETYGKEGCDGGWYAVRPKGFVCAGPAASIDPAVASRNPPAPPDLARALPYRYARARSENVPLYARAPSPADQLATEPDLKKVLGRDEHDPLGAAANDVPLDARGVATGPAVLVPGGDGIEGGKRTTGSFFTFGAEARPPSLVPAAEGVKVAALRKGSGVSITGSLELESISGLRRFAVTSDGFLVPTDRLRPALGSTWHGLDLDKVGLPVAFVHKLGVHTWSFSDGKAIKADDDVERRAAVPLTGKFRTVGGVRYEETREGTWMRAQDLVTIVKRHKYPEFVHAGQRWLDVSIANQTLTAYEGTKPVYATLVSTGRDQLKDPAVSASTPRGSFRVVGRHVTRAIDTKDVGGSFDVTDAPWVLDLDGGFAITGAYWGDGIGEAATFHDIELTPVDAHRLWTWAGGELPEGWQGVEGEDEGIMVSVRP